jgi:hypothetical protein
MFNRLAQICGAPFHRSRARTNRALEWVFELKTRVGMCVWFFIVRDDRAPVGLAEMNGGHTVDLCLNQ